MYIAPTIDSTLEMLRKFAIFADLPEAKLIHLAKNLHFAHYEKDSVIFYQGDAADRVWWVYQGQVKIVFHDLDGREVILEMISPGEVFGGAVLFFPTHPATAKALEDAHLASFSNEVYTQFLSEHPRLTIKLLRMLGARHLSMINMQILAGERVERRMAHILVKLASRTGKPDPDREGILITIPLSRQDLADMACTTLETAIRTISRFQKNGLVATRRGGYLVVKNPQKLKDLTG